MQLMTDKPQTTEHTTSEEEKRKDLRIPLRVLRVEGTEKGKKEIFFGYAGNISTSGMFIQTPNPKDVGTQVRLTFTLPTTKEKVTCVAEVVWSRNYAGKGSSPGMGMRFVDLAADMSAIIEKFMSSS